MPNQLSKVAQAALQQFGRRRGRYPTIEELEVWIDGEGFNDKADDFYESYWFIHNHSAFHHHVWIDEHVVKVNPETNRIDDDISKNTKVEVWLESGPYEVHDPDLDCGGETYEKAIITLAEKVKAKYGAGK